MAMELHPACIIDYGYQLTANSTEIIIEFNSLFPLVYNISPLDKPLHISPRDHSTRTISAYV